MSQSKQWKAGNISTLVLTQGQLLLNIEPCLMFHIHYCFLKHQQSLSCAQLIYSINLGICRSEIGFISISFNLT